MLLPMQDFEDMQHNLGSYLWKVSFMHKSSVFISPGVKIMDHIFLYIESIGKSIQLFWHKAFDVHIFHFLGWNEMQITINKYIWNA